MLKNYFKIKRLGKREDKKERKSEKVVDHLFEKVKRNMKNFIDGIKEFLTC